MTHAKPDFFHCKAKTATRERREPLLPNGGAARWRPIETLLRSRWPVRPLGRLSDRPGHPTADVAAHA